MSIFKLYHKHYENYLTLIAKVLGYNTEDFDELGQVYDHLDSHYHINDDTLYIDVEGDEYEYTISSFGARGRQLFMGKDGDHVFIMCHEADDFPENTFIVVVNKENELTEEEYFNN